MYEFHHSPVSGLGDVSRDFCNNLSYESLMDQHWEDCRQHVTAAHLCQLSDGAPCSREEIADFCAVRSASMQPADCASYTTPLDALQQLFVSDEPQMPPARRQVPTGNQDIRELQTWLESLGCSVGSHGIDGRWGPDTDAAVRCAEGQGHASVIATRFPFVATMRVTPTGQPRPADFRFDPGTSKKTPEQIVDAGNPGGAGGSVSNPGSTQTDIAVDREQRAGLFGALPWWGWTLIAVGGVGMLGLAGYVLLAGDDERSRRR